MRRKVFSLCVSCRFHKPEEQREEKIVHKNIHVIHESSSQTAVRPQSELQTNRYKLRVTRAYANTRHASGLGISECDAEPSNIQKLIEKYYAGVARL